MKDHLFVLADGFGSAKKPRFWVSRKPTALVSYSVFYYLQDIFHAPLDHWFLDVAFAPLESFLRDMVFVLRRGV